MNYPYQMKKPFLILWQVSRWDEQLLSLVVPGNIDASQRKQIMHSDDELTKTLRKIPTSFSFKIFFHESHPVTKMTLLTTLDKGFNDHFTYDEVKTLVNEVLDNTSEQEIEKFTNEIITTGIKINFVRKTDDGNYKIQSRFKKSSDRYEELKKKWIGYKIQEDKANQLSEAIKKLQEELESKKPSLDKF